MVSSTPCWPARATAGRRPAHDDSGASVTGYRHGSRTRSLMGTFGNTEITVPRARLQAADGGTAEWHSEALRAYQRRTRAVDVVIANAYLAGTNTATLTRRGRPLGASGLPHQLGS